jgi:hypothetical protein
VYHQCKNNSLVSPSSCSGDTDDRSQHGTAFHKTRDAFLQDAHKDRKDVMSQNLSNGTFFCNILIKES